MRALTWCVIGAVATAGLAPVPAMAQRGGQGEAVDACSRAIGDEVRDRFPQAGGVRFLSSDVSRDGDAEARVSGKGEFDDRNGGEARFGYGCTFNLRTGRTYALDVRDVRPADGKKSNDAAIVGLVLGAIVIGALAASANDKDKDRRRDRDDSWSPADGVRCSGRKQECYKDGHYSEKWTRRIFYR